VKSLPAIAGVPGTNQAMMTSYVETSLLMWKRKKLNGKTVIETLTKNEDNMQTTAGFVLDDPDVYKKLGHFACTNTHWSDHATSIELVKHILGPWLQKKKAELSLPSNQPAILIVDCWWGWLHQEFRDFLKKQYPTIKLVYVPPNTTPICQPIDLGIAARYKAILRRYYGESVTDDVYNQLKNGKGPEEVKVDQGMVNLKKNLATWTNMALLQMETKEEIVKAWRKIGNHNHINDFDFLAYVKDKKNQQEAVRKFQTLFNHHEDASNPIDVPDEAEKQEKSRFEDLSDDEMEYLINKLQKVVTLSTNDSENEGN
jgi:hypothetical protein